jgi:hypothetical protein
MMPNDIHPAAGQLSTGEAAQDPINPKKIKAKRYKGLIEWICDREGHEFLIDVDRSYIRDSFNHFGLKEKFFEELNIQCEKD